MESTPGFRPLASTADSRSVASSQWPEGSGDHIDMSQVLRAVNRLVVRRPWARSDSGIFARDSPPASYITPMPRSTSTCSTIGASDGCSIVSGRASWQARTTTLGDAAPDGIDLSEDTVRRNGCRLGRSAFLYKPGYFGSLAGASRSGWLASNWVTGAEVQGHRAGPAGVRGPCSGRFGERTDLDRSLSDVITRPRKPRGSRR